LLRDEGSVTRQVPKQIESFLRVEAVFVFGMWLDTEVGE
jgi:hypothetical protein